VDALFQPLQLAGVRLANRIMCSAMTLQYGERGLISDRHLAFYRERARGGVALLFSEQLTATTLSGSPFASELAAYDARQVERFAALAQALEPFETRFFGQLFAGGAVASSSAGLDGWGPVRAPSRVGMPGGEAPLPLTRGELEAIASDFAASAANVKAGGLDGVEVHGSHGWLVGQFLSPFYNRREDDYGGPVENRCRLAIEIGQAIRAEVGAGFPLGLSLSYDELIGDAGITPEDTLAQLEVLLRAGVYDFFDLSIGSSHAEHHTIAPMAVAEGFPLEFSGRAKALVGDRAAVFVAGRIVDPAMAARAVEQGAADMVAMSRAHLADPQLVRKAREGRIGEITRCIGANVCVARSLKGEPAACVLNPVTGREAAWGDGSLEPVPAGAARRVLIVGAGPAGLRAGAVAAARGHDVVVHERGDVPGGHLASMSWLPTRQGWDKAIEDMVAALERAAGDLRVASDLDAEGIELAGADVVVLATGASWDDSGVTDSRPGRAGMPNAGRVTVLALDAALEAARRAPRGLGARVLILDETGTYVPLGLAEALAVAGTRVDFVTPNGSVGADAAGHLELQHALPRLRSVGVSFTVGHDIEALGDGGVELADVWGGAGSTLAGVDTVVLATGRVSRDSLHRQLAERLPDVRLIGDALAPRPAEAVIQEAEACGRAL